MSNNINLVDAPSNLKITFDINDNNGTVSVVIANETGSIEFGSLTIEKSRQRAFFEALVTMARVYSPDTDTAQLSHRTIIDKNAKTAAVSIE